MSILRVAPRPVSVALCGNPLLASEFRISDLADLQAWAESIQPTSFESAALRLEFGPQDEAWKDLLSGVVDSLDDDGETIFNAAIESEEGTRKQVWFSLRRHSPQLTEDACTTLLAEGYKKWPVSTFKSVRQILRTAWATRPKDIARSLIDGISGSTGNTVDWEALYYRYITTAQGPAPPFEDLTLGQLRAWLTEGKDADEGRADWMEVSERRAKFWASPQPSHRSGG